MNENPRLATGLTVGLILLAVILIGWQLLPGGDSSTPRGKVYFTDDDGKTFFADDPWNIPPFKHNGKEAVRAHVYRCGPNGKLFVGWMEKYTEESRARLQKFFDDPKNHSVSLGAFDDAQKQLKRPGADEKWLKWLFIYVEKARNIRCSGGEQPEEMLPGQK
jgi:hypothetical protein